MLPARPGPLLGRGRLLFKVSRQICFDFGVESYISYIGLTSLVMFYGSVWRSVGCTLRLQPCGKTIRKDRQTSETGRQADQAVVTVNGKLHGIANKRMHRIHVHP